MKRYLFTLIFGVALLGSLIAAWAGQDTIVLQGSEVILRRGSQQFPHEIGKGLPGLKMVSYEKKVRVVNEAETDVSELTLRDTAGTTATLTTGQPLEITVTQRGGETLWLLPRR